jgi:hypothetical protein
MRVSVKIVAVGVQNMHDWLKIDAIASAYACYR